MKRIRGYVLWIGVAAVAAAMPFAIAKSWELRVCAEPDNLPYSNQAGEGFDNRIAEILAEELGADLAYVWLPDLQGATRQRYIEEGACDLVMGVLDGQDGFSTSYAYYRTGYVFLYPEDVDYEITSLDDEILHELSIGVPGGPRKLVPPAMGLVNRGVVENKRYFDRRREAGEHYEPVVEAVADGAVEVGIVWGPAGGHYAEEEGGVVVAPVRPEIDPPFVPMVASLTIGVRSGDASLRDMLDRALARTWEETREVLEEAGVPMISLPQPVDPTGERGR